MEFIVIPNKTAMVVSHDAELNINNLPSKLSEQVHKEIFHFIIKLKYFVYLVQLCKNSCKYFLLEKVFQRHSKLYQFSNWTI